MPDNLYPKENQNPREAVGKHLHPLLVLRVGCEEKRQKEPSLGRGYASLCGSPPQTLAPGDMRKGRTSASLQATRILPLGLPAQTVPTIFPVYLTRKPPASHPPRDLWVSVLESTLSPSQDCLPWKHASVPGARWHFTSSVRPLPFSHSFVGILFLWQGTCLPPWPRIWPVREGITTLLSILHIPILQPLSCTALLKSPGMWKHLEHGTQAGKGARA